MSTQTSTVAEQLKARGYGQTKGKTVSPGGIAHTIIDRRGYICTDPITHISLPKDHPDDVYEVGRLNVTFDKEIHETVCFSINKLLYKKYDEVTFAEDFIEWQANWELFKYVVEACGGVVGRTPLEAFMQPMKPMSDDTHIDVVSGFKIVKLLSQMRVIFYCDNVDLGLEKRINNLLTGDQIVYVDGKFGALETKSNKYIWPAGPF